MLLGQLYSAGPSTRKALTAWSCRLLTRMMTKSVYPERGCHFASPLLPVSSILLFVQEFIPFTTSTFCNLHDLTAFISSL